MLGAFNEETPDWVSFFMFTYFHRPGRKMQLESLAQSELRPASRTLPLHADEKRTTCSSAKPASAG